MFWIWSALVGLAGGGGTAAWRSAPAASARPRAASAATPAASARRAERRFLSDANERFIVRAPPDGSIGKRRDPSGAPSSVAVRGVRDASREPLPGVSRNRFDRTAVSPPTTSGGAMSRNILLGAGAAAVAALVAATAYAGGGTMAMGPAGHI